MTLRLVIVYVGALMGNLRLLSECQASVVFVSPLYYMTSSLVDIQYAETIAPFLKGFVWV